MPIPVPADAASLLQAHRELLSSLPVTFRAYLGVEAARWPTLFTPEKERLAALFDALGGPDVSSALGSVARLEKEAGCGEIRESDARKLQDATQALLRRKGLLPTWRQEVDRVFERLQPALDRRLYPPDGPRRVVVVSYAQGIAIQRDNLWARLRGGGVRVPLRLDGAASAEPLLRALFAPGGTTLFSALGSPESSWIVETGDLLHTLYGGAPPAATGLSYARLRPYRVGRARSRYKRVVQGVSGPQELAADARGLEVGTPAASLLTGEPRVTAFAQDVLLGGNGALLVNNTFVEWAAVQALRRAEPRLLVARFGVRDKMKAFSSLLLFSGPRPTDQVPVLEDPLGSFVDVEQLSYYVWLQAEKSAAYRGKTLYLVVADGVDEALVLRPAAAGPGPAERAAASPGALGATLAAWLGVDAGAREAPIAALTS